MNNTALLVMDMQSAMLGMIPEAAAIVSNVATAIAHARIQGIPVIYVVVGFRKGAPEISENNKGFMASKGMLSGLGDIDFTAIHPDLAPQENEVTVLKRRVSAFSGSDLQVVLSAFKTEHLVLTGIATSGVVLSTLREAADKDFRITVLSDGCGDREAAIHTFLNTHIFPRQADVMTVADWVK